MFVRCSVFKKRSDFFKGFNFTRCLTQSCTKFEITEPTNAIKKDIEAYWKDKINRGTFNPNKGTDKYYVLSMFPYPSGNLHMGHVRVYSISDAMARFYRMNGKNVFHPMGWDAFGLPAENAAIERKIEPSDWTKQNIVQMKEQLIDLGCSFDWDHEVTTCDKNYYKWTQKLFLMLYKEGLVYQNEALVNWDPVDKTVLADEQVDSNGCSWRSGAKVEKKLLKQWFIRTTKFAKDLLDGLSDPCLQDWKDIVNLQQHWIGDCNGYIFNLKTVDNEENYLNSIRIWTEFPEYMLDPNVFVVMKTTHHLKKIGKTSSLQIFNPFTNQTIPLVFYNDVEFPEQSECYLAAPSFVEKDKKLARNLSLPCQSVLSRDLVVKNGRELVLKFAQKKQIGGYKVSSKLQDWLISRQRYWGTPIPIVHCEKCGAVPVNEEELPVLLPEKHLIEAIQTECPKCGDTNAKRETDTMDTFIDSSWYYLRYLDAKNDEKLFDETLIKKFMPVDLYVGGKEHAVLHLYYARFMNHFLHSLGLVPYSEPFNRLLVQGMVMGRSYRVKGSGKYLKKDEVEIVDVKKNKAKEKSTGAPVVMLWEKMSKSKFNGVDPSEMISEYGCDTTRLILLADVAPTSHRNWSDATFPGILNWQKRLWLTLYDFYNQRARQDDDKNFNLSDQKFSEEEEKLFDSRNYYIKGVTFNIKHSQQLSVGISKMQGLTNSLRRASPNVIKHGKQFERALAAQIIMLAPMAPHYASELWSKFVATPNRINTSSSDEISWENDVLEQRWPEVDMEYKLDLTVKINGFENCVVKIPRSQLDKITFNEAMDIAFNTESVTSYVTDRKIKTTNFVHYPGCEAILNIYLEKPEKRKNESEKEEKLANK